MNRRSHPFDRQLCAAIRAGQIIPWYQPIVELTEGRVIGVEVLARWQKEDGDFVSPEQFITRAELLGRIVPLTLGLIRRVQAEVGSLGLPAGASIAINVPPDALDDPGLLDELERFGLWLKQRHWQLTVEMTERGYVDFAQTAHINAAFARLAAASVQLALDDFGAGYSALGHLHRFSFHCVKIDGVFIDGIGQDARLEVILRGLVAISKSLGFRLVAERIETAEQAAWLLRQGVDAGQGYFFGKPAPASAWASKAVTVTTPRKWLNAFTMLRAS